ncbi:MAG: ABC transporter substrate-binding protein [Acidobacteriota bacterium]|nr:ABC transporter substrate-binding protein [Acidobacteriota bacterium]
MKRKSNLSRISPCVSLIISFLLFLFASNSVYSSKRTVIIAIKSRDIAPHKSALKGFKDYLNRQKIDTQIIELSLKGKRKNDFSNIREEIESKHPDLVLTLGTPATKIAQEVVKDIPVVFTMVLDPKGGKILPPGVSMDIPPEIKLKIIKRVLPGAKRIGLIYSANSTPDYKEILQISRQFGIQIIGEEINSREEFPDLLKHLWMQIDCFLMIPDSKIYFLESVEYLLIEGLRRKIPIIGLSSSYTRAGALISFDCNYEDLGEQAAEIALKILAGENLVKTQFIPPRKISFSLNMLAAEKLEIEVPSEIIKAAKEVFGK